MKAKIMISNRHDQIEPYADIKVKYSSLYATDIRADEIPLMIDEVPVLMTAAAFAGGTTRIYGLKELKVKETDRIQSMVYNLKKAGADIKPFYDKKKKDWQVFIKGKAKIKSSDFKSFNDHRTAMSMIIFALASGKDHTIDDVKCIDKSFPEFMGIITKLRK